MDQTQGYGGQPTGYTTSAHPELHSTNPSVASAAPEKKPGIADKVKGLLGGHGHKTDHAAQAHQPGVYGDATPASGTPASTRVGCLDKLKAKTGVGHGHAPAQTRAQGGGLMGHHTDPSASPDFNGGTNVNSSAAVHGGWPHPMNPNPTAVGEPHPMRETHNHPTGLPNPNAAMAGGYGGAQGMNPNATVVGEPHHMRETHNHPTGLPNPNAATAGGYGGAQGMNPNATVVGEPHHMRDTHNHPTGLPNPFSQPNPNAGGYGGAQPTNPTGVTNPQGGAVLGDYQGNVYEGPRDDNEKKEGFVSKVMDKLHSPKGKPAHNTTTPSTY